MRATLQELARKNITVRQALALMELHTSDSRTPTQLAISCEMSTAATTGTIDKLVKTGYAEREFNAEGADRRKVNIRLTAEGKQFAAVHLGSNCPCPKCESLNVSEEEDWVRPDPDSDFHLGV